MKVGNRAAGSWVQLALAGTCLLAFQGKNGPGPVDWLRPLVWPEEGRAHLCPLPPGTPGVHGPSQGYSEQSDPTTPWSCQSSVGAVGRCSGQGVQAMGTSEAGEGTAVGETVH